jgi:hypothetical protein
MPKTAGHYFSSAIHHALRHDQILKASFNHSQGFINLKTNSEEFYNGKEHFIQYVNSLALQQKQKIQYIEGHDAFYGIHNIIASNARYFAFFRDPIARTVSLYNFERMVWEMLSTKENMDHFLMMLKKRIIDNFLVDGKVPAFEYWLHKIYKYNHQFYSSMSDYLEYLQYIDHKRDEGSFTEALSKFYFVGITEKFDLDSRYLFNLLNIKNPSGTVNNATPYVTLKSMSPSLINQIKDVNIDDFVLYQCALIENEKFKSKNNDFSFKVMKNKFIQKIYQARYYMQDIFA